MPVWVRTARAADLVTEDAVGKAREKVQWQAVKIDIELLKQPEIPKKTVGPRQK